MKRDYGQMFGGLPAPYRYQPLHELEQSLTELPRKLKRTALEVTGMAGALFLAWLLLANSSGDLKDYRAYFLSGCRNISVAAVASWGAYRILRSCDNAQNR